MARLNLCPVCGERMTLEAKANAAGDSLERWRCNVTNDYQGEWDITALAAGTTDIVVADRVQENPEAREITAARGTYNLTTLLTDLLGRIGPVTPGTSLVEEMRRVYGAVDTLELSSDSIALNADAINLNTDTLEGLVTSTNTRVGDPADPDTADTLIGRAKRLVTLIGQAEAARDVDATTAQARLDLLATEGNLNTTRDTLAARLDTAIGFLDEMPTVAEMRDTRQIAERLMQRQARNGLSYTSSSGLLQLGVAGNVRATIANPSGSGRRMFLDRLIISASAGPGYARIHINPTNGVPALTRPVNNALVGVGGASPVVLSADVNTTVALSGGADTGLVLAIPAGRTQIELNPLIIPPGITMGINIPYAGALDSVLTAYWWEEVI